jgi:hypothetical protein
MLSDNFEPRRVRAVLLLALVLVAAGLLGLAAADSIVPTGWKFFVLAKILKAGWAGAVAVLAAAGVLATFELLAAPRDATRRSSRLIGAGLRGLVALIVGIAALGYLMPDWNLWTVSFPFGLLIVWALALWLTVRSGKRQ